MTFIPPKLNAKQSDEPEKARRAVAIGASAGAIEALLTILPKLEANFPAPIFIVVHLPPKDRSLLAELFQPRCAIRVVEAEDKSIIEDGTAYFAPPDYHLLIETDFRLSLSSEEPIHYSRPSIDAMFESAAVAFGGGLVGVILTGANADGAQGLARIAQLGGEVMVQEPEMAFASAMPKAALAACPKAIALPLDQIALQIIEVLQAK